MFGSGATMAGLRPMSRSAATGFGPRATRVTRPQGLGEGCLGITRGQQAIQLARADSGQQDHHVELAGEEALGEGEGFVVVRQRNLPHGRRDERLALLLADQLLHLRGAPALQREHAQSVEAHVRDYSEAKTAFTQRRRDRKETVKIDGLL